MFTKTVMMAKRHNAVLGVLYLDLDRFKHINDSVGHAVGDRVLQAAEVEVLLKNADSAMYEAAMTAWELTSTAFARARRIWEYRLEQYGGTRVVGRRTIRNKIVYWTWNEDLSLVSYWPVASTALRDGLMVPFAPPHAIVVASGYARSNWNLCGIPKGRDT